jgi:peroxiredoxin
MALKTFSKSLLCILCLWLPLQAMATEKGSGERPRIPELSFPDLAGESHNLREWEGKVLLINFWASWCAPCQAEIRHLVEYQQAFGPQGLQVVGLGLDSPRKLRNVQRSLGINYPILVVDAKESRSILRSWGNKSGLIPFTVIFDKSGRVVRAHKGIIDDQQFDLLVKPLLQTPVE